MDIVRYTNIINIIKEYILFGISGLNLTIILYIR